MPIVRTFAQVYEQLSTHLREDSASAWFVVYLHRELGLSPPRSFSSLPPGDLHDAPTLATTGYAIEAIPEIRSQSLFSRWASAFERVMDRNLFPRDRQSFVHRPLQLLGICLGALNLDITLSVFNPIFTRLAEEHLDEDWGDIINWHAARRVGASFKSAPNFSGSLTLPSLSLLICLAAATSMRMNIAQTESLRSSDFQRGLLQRLLIEEVEERDIARLGAIRAGLFLSARQELGRLLDEHGTATASGSRLRSEAISLVQRVFDSFHAFALELRNRQRDRTPFEIRDEYDVQDLMRAMLGLQFDEVLPEEHTPSFAGSSSRMDFVLRRERIVVETKMTRPNLKQQDLADELIVDHRRYSTHPFCDVLMCFAYDPDRRLHQPRALETDLQNVSGPPSLYVSVRPF
jgi:REase_DpnII-MboI